MSDFCHDADTETPAASGILAEAGLDPRAIREILAGSDTSGEWEGSLKRMSGSGLESVPSVRPPIIINQYEQETRSCRLV